MSASSPSAPAGSLLARVIGLLIAVLLTAASAGLGLYQNLPMQEVILYAAGTLALSAWIWRFYVVQFAADGGEGASELRRAWLRYRYGIAGFLVLLGVFIALSLMIDGFFNIWTVISALILLLIIVLTMSVGRFMAENRSAFIGLMVLAGLFSVGSMNIDGFSSAANIKSMLLFASFLGLASIGQTLVALLGGLDLSIPYVIGAANVGLLYLIGLGVPPWLAVILIVIAGAIIGVINGVLSLRLQGQALIVTLGAGFVVSGGTQIITSIGSEYSGNVFGTVPDWLTNLSSMAGSTFGLPFPPVIAIWGVLALALIVGLRHTVYGRFLFALGVNRTSADRLFISESGYWITMFGLSGMFSAITGCLRLERRRLHRRGLVLSFHDAGGGRGRRHLAAGRRRRLRLHGDRRAGSAGVDLVPCRHRPQIRVATVHLRRSDPSDGGAVCTLAAHPNADLTRRAMTPRNTQEMAR